MDVELVEIKDKQKIVKIISQMVLNASSSTIWQNKKNSNGRITYSCKFDSYNPLNDELIFLPEGEKFLIDSSQMIYFLNPTKSILFKLKITQCTYFKLTTKLPKIIMITEMRKEKREDLTDKNSSISYYYGSKQETLTQQFHYSSKLLDYSPGGLSFNSNLRNISQFTVGDKMMIRLDNKDKTIKPAKIANITRQQTENSNQKTYRVGISFL